MRCSLFPIIAEMCNSRATGNPEEIQLLKNALCTEVPLGNSIVSGRAPQLVEVDDFHVPGPSAFTSTQSRLFGKVSANVALGWPIIRRVACPELT